MPETNGEVPGHGPETNTQETNTEQQREQRKAEFLPGVEPKVKEAFADWIEHDGINRIRDMAYRDLHEDDTAPRKNAKLMLLQIAERFSQAHGEGKEASSYAALVGALRQKSEDEIRSMLQEISKAAADETTVELKGTTYGVEAPAFGGKDASKAEKKKNKQPELHYIEFTASINTGKKSFLRTVRVLDNELNAATQNENVEVQEQNRRATDEAFRQMVEDNEGVPDVQATRLDMGDKQKPKLMFWVDNRHYNVPLEEAMAGVQDIVSHPELIEECLKYRQTFPAVEYPTHDVKEEGRVFRMPGNAPVRAVDRSFDNQAHAEAIEQERRATQILEQFRYIPTSVLELLRTKGQEVVGFYLEYKQARANGKVKNYPSQVRPDIFSFTRAFEIAALYGGRTPYYEQALGNALALRVKGELPPAEAENLRVRVHDVVELFKDNLHEISLEEWDSMTGSWNERQLRELYSLIIHKLHRDSDTDFLERDLERYHDKGFRGQDYMEFLRTCVKVAGEHSRDAGRDEYIREYTVEKTFGSGEAAVELVRHPKKETRFAKLTVQYTGKQRKYQQDLMLPLPAGFVLETEDQASRIRQRVDALAEANSITPRISSVSGSRENPMFHFSLGKDRQTRSLKASYEQLLPRLNFYNRVMAEMLKDHYLDYRDLLEKEEERPEPNEGERMALAKFKALLTQAGLPSISEQLIARIIASEFKSGPKPLPSRRAVTTPLPQAAPVEDAEPEELSKESSKVLDAEFVDEEKIPERTWDIDKVPDEVLLKDVGMAAAYEAFDQAINEYYGDFGNPHELEALKKLAWKMERRKIAEALKVMSRISKQTKLLQ